MLVHSLDYAGMFATIKSHLAPDGQLFLRKELDDTLLFKKGKNLISELRPFHFQQFYIAVLGRILRRFGFQTHELCGKNAKKPDIIGIATRDDRTEFEPIALDELEARLKMYREWKDESLLALPPERAEALFGEELEQAKSRVSK